MTILAASDLGFAYRTRQILQGVSLQIRAGEVFAIIGPNGAGKTTLLRLLARLARAQTGRVTLNGVDLWSLTARKSASQIAYVPQAAEPSWPLTVQEYVALGRAPHRGWWWPLTAEDWAAITSALDCLGLAECSDRPITELSGGEWQRVRLAQALTRQPGIMLLDEPTTHLDPRYQREVLSLVRQLASGGFAVAVTLHDLNLASGWVDQVALLAGGRLLTCGPPDQVLTPEWLFQAYGIWLPVAPHPLTGAPMVALTVERS